MKHTLLLAAALTFSVILKAQEQTLSADQNPRYRESMEHYMSIADSLTANQGATVQDTYKAYDFYQARLERRAQRREWRQQAWLNGSWYTPYWGTGFGSSWGFNNYWSPYRRNGWNLGFGYGRWW